VLITIDDQRIVNLDNLISFHPATGKMLMVSQRDITLNDDHCKTFIAALYARLTAKLLPKMMIFPSYLINIDNVEQVIIEPDATSGKFMLVNKTWLAMSAKDVEVLTMLICSKQDRFQERTEDNPKLWTPPGMEN